MSLSCANLRYSIMASSRGIAPFSSCFFVTASSILFLDFPFWSRIDSGMKFSPLRRDFKLKLIGWHFIQSSSRTQIQSETVSDSIVYAIHHQFLNRPKITRFVFSFPISAIFGLNLKACQFYPCFQWAVIFAIQIALTEIKNTYTFVWVASEIE